MNKTRWIIATLVVTGIVMFIEGFFHSVVLGEQYAATAALWRPMPEMGRLMPVGWLASLVSFFVLYYIYHRGYQGRGNGIAEGLRFGLIIGLFSGIPMAVWSYITIPMTLTIAIGWFVVGMINFLVAGAIFGAIYKRATA